jgi:histidinol-phosphate aminotransferase
MSVIPNKHVGVLQPYKVSESGKLAAHDKDKFIKLDWNESTYPPAPGVKKVLADFVEKGLLNYYPDVNAAELRERLSGLLTVPVECIQVFNGSDAALRDICLAYLDEGEIVLVREPVYTQMYTFIEARGAGVEVVMGRDPFEKALGCYTAALDRGDVKMVYIPNPNNPTGTLYERDEIEQLVRKYPRVLFIMDEAYSEFAGKSVADLAPVLPNLIVARTFSKAFGLAGIRMGYIICTPGTLDYIDRVRNGKEVNTLAQLAAIAAVDEIEYMRGKVREVRENRVWIVGKLREAGFAVTDTPANFIIVKVTHVKDLVDGLKARRILVRDRSYMPQLEGCVRISIGMRDEMEKLLSALIELKQCI